MLTTQIAVKTTIDLKIDPDTEKIIIVNYFMKLSKK
jgi:hypothetical protein